VAELHERLRRAGLEIAFSPGPNPVPEGESEARRWLAAHPRADPAAGFRAGWARMARFVAPRLREWESRWRAAMRQNDHLRAQIGILLRELSRLSDDA
jgi:hypothetical protein